jgi:hypothetical protein
VKKRENVPILPLGLRPDFDIINKTNNVVFNDDGSVSTRVGLTEVIWPKDPRFNLGSLDVSGLIIYPGEETDPPPDPPPYWFFWKWLTEDPTSPVPDPWNYWYRFIPKGTNTGEVEVIDPADPDVVVVREPFVVNVPTPDPPARPEPPAEIPAVWVNDDPTPPAVPPDDSTVAIRSVPVDDPRRFHQGDPLVFAPTLMSAIRGQALYEVLAKASGGREPYRYFIPEQDDTQMFLWDTLYGQTNKRVEVFTSGLAIQRWQEITSDNGIDTGWAKLSVQKFPWTSTTKAVTILCMDADGTKIVFNGNIKVTLSPPVIDGEPISVVFPPGVVSSTTFSLVAGSGALDKQWFLSKVPPGLSFDSATATLGGTPTDFEGYLTLSVWDFYTGTTRGRATLSDSTIVWYSSKTAPGPKIILTGARYLSGCWVVAAYTRLPGGQREGGVVRINDGLEASFPTPSDPTIVNVSVTGTLIGGLAWINVNAKAGTLYTVTTDTPGSTISITLAGDILTITATSPTGATSTLTLDGAATNQTYSSVSGSTFISKPTNTSPVPPGGSFGSAYPVIATPTSPNPPTSPIPAYNPTVAPTAQSEGPPIFDVAPTQAGYVGVGYSWTGGASGAYV